jgi:hypothetical protein
MSKLLQDCELVRDRPIFDDSSLDEAHDADLRPLHGLSGCGDPTIGTLMRGPPRSAGRDLVSFRDLVLDRDVYVREGDTPGRHELFDSVAGYRLPVEEHRRGEHLIHYFQLLLVPDFFEESPSDRFVLFGVMRAPSLMSNAYVDRTAASE